MSKTHEIPVSSVGKIINAASAAGVGPEKLCGEAGVDLRTLEDVDNLISFADFMRLYQCGVSLTGDDAFGLHVGERDSPKLYGILGYVTINSRNVGEALNRLVRFQQIRSNAYKFSVEVSGASVHLSYFYLTNEFSRQQRRHEAEETLCSIMQFARTITGIEWSPREVHFEHERPANVSEHERIFRAPVRFRKAVTKLIFDSSVLNMPIVTADLTLGSLLERQAEELLAKSASEEKTFTSRVRELIRKNLSGGKIRMEAFGRELGVSSRTLQRQLSEEGTSFQKLLEETQCEVSKIYLEQPEIAICEISYLLGFSQASAFHRAFRRWTGLTPKEFRLRRKEDRRRNS